MNRALPATVLICCAPLVACATLGTHVKGNFACQAPGGTCAPTSVIDDQALQQLVGDPVGATPAGPYVAPPAARSPVIAARAGVDKVLRVVFPAYTDRQGRLHEASAIQAVVRVPYPANLPADTSVAYHGPSLGELASAAPDVTFPASTPDAPTTGAPTAGTATVVGASDYPSKAAIDAARAKARQVAVAVASGATAGAFATTTPSPRTQSFHAASAPKANVLVRGTWPPRFQSVPAPLPTPTSPVVIGATKSGPVLVANKPAIMPVGSIVQ